MATRSGSSMEDFIVITGFSGAGKSQAMACFEDAGYFCVDNLPPEMIPSLTNLFEHEGSKVERAAIVSDVRGGDSFEGIARVLDDLSARGLNHRVLFLEATEEALIARHKETRRPHPLAGSDGIEQAIARERELLAPLAERADVRIDTTDSTAARLRRTVAERMLTGEGEGRLAVTVLSYGFKHGTPRDADLVFDVRFLPNPHYEPDLRELTGLDPPVVDFVERSDGVQDFYARLLPLLDYLLPAYGREGKTQLTVGIGCTGGRHRSVAIGERLARELAGRPDCVVAVVHRDVDRLPRRA
jgi:RNase adapter protein RapZ